MASYAQPASFNPSPVTRAVAFFSGSVGLAIKIGSLSIVNAVSVWAAYVLASRSQWTGVAATLAATAAIDAIFLARGRWTVPAKFLVPGAVFLVAFQLIPIIYTVGVAFSNYSTGHVISKADAVRAIEANSLEPVPNGRQFQMTPAYDNDGHLALLLRDESSGALYVGTKTGLTPLAKRDARVDPATGVAGARGYTVIKGAALFALDPQLRALVVPTSHGAAIQSQGVTQALELRPTLRYDEKHDRFIRISDGLVFGDNGRGSFAASNDAASQLEPGWKSYTGFQNFKKLVTNPLYRTPFLRVFVWTFVFASLVVGLSFAIGLLFAIALNEKGMPLQRLYRSGLILPYAIPGFLSLLVWAGLLNDDFGVVNRLFHIHVPWLFDANWARVSVIFVSVWLTVPYFFLVSLGALQSIPDELTEAAKVDGGGSFAIFRRVTFPLLLVAVAPLMIASFAMNFNNFNNIYLLTGGGPYTSDTSSVAGSTDILISYTYKLAIASGKGQDYGLASSVAIIIFLVVASISGISFWKSGSLENMA